MTPLSAVPLLTLVGLGLYAHGFPQLAECIEILLSELIILIILSQHFLQHRVHTVTNLQVPKSVAVLTNLQVPKSGLISGAAWISFPYPWQYGTPSAEGAGDAFVMIAAALVALIEVDFFSSISVFILEADRITLDSNAMGENVGLLALTRSGSQRVVQISAGFMLFFAIFGKFGAVLASIPLLIFGAVYCILFAYMASAGIGLLQFCNLNKLRTKFVVAYSIFMGLSITQYFYGYIVTSGRGPVHTNAHWFNTIVEIIFTSPATVAVVIAVFLDSTIRSSRTDSGIFDNGRHWWERFRDFERHPMSREFYYLPSGLTKYFPSV
ncbi:hypothetical protein RHMOL_Rhmol11G0228500 [Rhododendron molle]|uniref:Uncharacterized protein n=1 Tax=Rhododendron molle TaxID=49168 RepID=A0ACC0LV83_RHOML|nr:hypothetical protein RHMOL_Rhmol11G0228500 [Rhododendron molle]